jgi:uncharacterized membrane protein SirB2
MGTFIDALQAAYPALKTAHVALVAASGTLFAGRGLGVLAGRPWPMAAAVRRASVTIDALLLAAGVSMWTALGLHPARDAWLGVKLALLVAYVVVGSVALKRGRTPRARARAFAAALGLFVAMVWVALAKWPAGWVVSWHAAPAGTIIG